VWENYSNHVIKRVTEMLVIFVYVTVYISMRNENTPLIGIIFIIFRY